MREVLPLLVDESVCVNEGVPVPLGVAEGEGEAVLDCVSDPVIVEDNDCERVWVIDADCDRVCEGVAVGVRPVVTL